MSSKAQRRILIGKETVSGTAVTVDTALRAVANLKPVADKVQVEEDIGTFAQARHYLASYHAEGDLEMTGYYEHLPYPVSMALGTYGTPTDLGGGLYEWHFWLPNDVANTFATFTLEYTDGADHIVKADDVFATALQISGTAGEGWELNDDLVGAEVTLPAAVSASPATPTATSVRMADTKLYIDGAYDDLGNTEVDVLVSFDWKLENYQHQKMFAGTLYPTGRGNDKWQVTLELILEVEDADVEVEINKILTTTESAIRIEATSGDYSATIDGNYFLSEVDTLDDRDGNNIIKLTYLAQKDSSDNTGEVKIVTSLAAL